VFCHSAISGENENHVINLNIFVFRIGFLL